MSRLDEAKEIARQLTYVADEIADRGYSYPGPLRVAARRITDLAAQLDLRDVDTDDQAGVCRGCGASFAQKSTGRPREWCSSVCKQRHRRR